MGKYKGVCQQSCYKYLVMITFKESYTGWGMAASTVVVAQARGSKLDQSEPTLKCQSCGVRLQFQHERCGDNGVPGTC